MQLEERRFNQGNDGGMVEELRVKIQRLMEEKERLIEEIDVQKTQVNHLRTEIQIVKNRPRDDKLGEELINANKRIETLTTQLLTEKGKGDEEASRIVEEKNQKIQVLEEKLDKLTQMVQQ